MTHRILVASLVLAVAATAAGADILVVKSRKGPDVMGLPSKVEGVEITVDNYKTHLEQSTGVISRVGWDGIGWKDRESQKTEKVYPLDEVIDYVFSTEPQSLLDAYDRQRVGSYPQAIGYFRDVLKDAEARTVYKIEANYQIGICYLQSGNLKSALKHFAAWQDVGKSRYTPEVYRLLAEIYTGQKDYAKARQAYQQIGGLDGITDNWKLKARLGGAKVDLEELKYGEAENTAKDVSSAAASKNLNDVRAEADTVRAKAVLAAGAKDRLPEAQQLLEKAKGLDGVSPTTQAFLYTNLGHVIYAQGKPEDARYPYLRVVLMFPNESSMVADALQNAGQCFLDMAGRQAEDKEKSNELFMRGMSLLGECIARHRGTGAAVRATRTYRDNKARYDALNKASAAAGGEAPSGCGEGDAGAN